ncbi:hypothetical protein U1Q18_039410 [Sarracenia purpurea var. burkii]
MRCECNSGLYLEDGGGPDLKGGGSPDLEGDGGIGGDGADLESLRAKVLTAMATIRKRRRLKAAKVKSREVVGISQWLNLVDDEDENVRCHIWRSGRQWLVEFDEERGGEYTDASEAYGGNGEIVEAVKAILVHEVRARSELPDQPNYKGSIIPHVLNNPKVERPR